MPGDERNNNGTPALCSMIEAVGGISWKLMPIVFYPDPNLQQTAEIAQNDGTIILKAFGTQYKVQRAHLSRIPYFAAALSVRWGGTALEELSISPEELDDNITRHALKQALHLTSTDRVAVLDLSAEEVLSLFALGNWLGWSEMIDATVKGLLDYMELPQLGFWFKAMATGEYGLGSKIILARAKALLCRHGANALPWQWDNVPAEVVRDVVSCHAFVVSTEWHRFKLLKDVLDHRLKLESPDNVQLGKTTSATRLGTAYRRGLSDSVEARHLAVYESASIVPLVEALDHGVYYAHMPMRELQAAFNATDALGRSLFPDDMMDKHFAQKLATQSTIVGCARNKTGLVLSTPYSHASEDLADKVLYPLPPEPEGDDRGYEELDPDDTGHEQPILSHILSGSVSQQHFPQWPPHWLGDSLPSFSGWRLCSKVAPLRFSLTIPSLRMLQEATGGINSEAAFYAGSMWWLRVQLLSSKDYIRPLRIRLERDLPDAPWRLSLPEVDRYVDERTSVVVRFEVCISAAGGRMFSSHKQSAVCSTRYDIDQIRLKESWVTGEFESEGRTPKAEALRGNDQIMFTVTLFAV